MNSNYIQLTTLDNTTVYINKSLIGGIEEIPATSRSEAYLKLYTAGFKFMVKISFDELIQKITE